MTPRISNIDLTSLDEYNRLLYAYLDAKQAYALDDTQENWDLLQEALVALKRHTDRMDMKRKVVKDFTMLLLKDTGDNH